MEHVATLKIKNLFRKNSVAKRITLYVTKFIKDDRVVLNVFYDKENNRLVIPL